MAGPGEWFLQLRKPSFNPPTWLFGPVWTLLYVVIAVAGWRVWARRDELGRLPLRLWIAQLVANFLWSPIFFGAHRIDLALGVIVVLLLCILAFIASTARRDRLAASLFVPYAAWVSFATALNAAFLALNPSN
jgi:tryptophan-rich sensory protein